MAVIDTLLGLLADGPAHGYEIKHQHDDQFPGTRPLAYGQVYAALAKAEGDGLVEVVETVREAGPDRTTYALTERGQARLAEWLAIVEPAGPYAADDLVRKVVTSLRLGKDAAGFLRRQRELHLAAMRNLVELQQATDEPQARIVIDHAIEHLDADLRWLGNAVLRTELTTNERGRS